MTQHMTRWSSYQFWLLPAAALAVGLATSPASAGYLASNDESFSYVGTVTSPDGTAHTIPSYVSTPSSTTYPGPDASVFLTSAAPTVDAGAGSENFTQFGTNWYSSLNGNNDGTGNPNNTNTGFVQLYDTTNSHVTSQSGGWTDATYTTFTIKIAGGAAADPNDRFNRLWAAPEVGGPGVDTAGGFTSYTLTLTATFKSGDVTEEFPGWFSTTDAPLSVTGSFIGIFDNDSAEAAAADSLTATPGLDGNYQFDLTFTDTNWAAANGIPDVYGSYFGASQVPEPASLALLGSALFGFGLIRRRRS